MSATAADYNAVVTACRDAIALGKHLNGQDYLRIIRVLEQVQSQTTSVNAAVTTVNTDYTAQMAILSAFTAMDAAATIVAAIATAKALLDPDVAALVSDKPTAPSPAISANTVLDGLPLAGSA